MKLTHIHTNVTAEQVNHTYRGMAHGAMTGPPGKSCRLCRWWEPSGYYAGSGQMLKPGRCARYRMMTREQLPPLIVHHARACKYFEENPVPPTITRKL